MNSRKRWKIHSRFPKQTVNLWYFREIDSETAKSQMNAKGIREIGIEFIVTPLTRWVIQSEVVN